MHITIAAPHLNPLTHETLQEYALKKIEKIKKFFSEEKYENMTARISADKVREEFHIKMDIHNSKEILVKTKDKDLRKAIDMAVDDIVRALNEEKEKKIRH